MKERHRQDRRRRRASKPKWLKRLFGRKRSNRVDIEPEPNTMPRSSDGSLPSTSWAERGNDPRSEAVVCDASTQTSAISQDCATQVVACSDKATSMDDFTSQDGVSQATSEGSLFTLLEYIIHHGKSSTSCK
ncbi:hypothetical protein AAFF_G00389730 [Aldrovandia affinis]|uniref:Uncharacterized protein n=1 Tax=Aldrovandia affinis TaxID=143900 RepID=A0AAD7SGH3_9TELE|nr:hypothetical protein AAFF_G00389730 [Aldrovandia affinis]